MLLCNPAYVCRVISRKLKAQLTAAPFNCPLRLWNWVSLIPFSFHKLRCGVLHRRQFGRVTFLGENKTFQGPNSQRGAVSRQWRRYVWASRSGSHCCSFSQGTMSTQGSGPASSPDPRPQWCLVGAVFLCQRNLRTRNKCRLKPSHRIVCSDRRPAWGGRGGVCCDCQAHPHSRSLVFSK